MTTMTKAKLDAIRADTQAALDAVATKHGLSKYKLGKMIYSDDGFHAKVDAVLEGGRTKEAITYDANHEFMDLPVRGTAFNSNGLTFTISGMNTTGSKVRADANGKTYLFKTDDVAKICKRQAALSKAS